MDQAGDDRVAREARAVQEKQQDDGDRRKRIEGGSRRTPARQHCGQRHRRQQGQRIAVE